MTTQAILAPTGNTFIDTLSQVSGLVTTTADNILQTGGTFLDKFLAYKIALKQNVADPVYVPAPVSNATSSAKMNNILIGVGVLGAVGVVAWALMRK